MATVKGIWVFNETLTYLPENGWYAFINNFLCDGVNYKFISTAGNQHTIQYWYNITNSITVYNSAWMNDAYRTVDFGETEQSVMDEFYDWLTANAQQKIIKIDITENGTTTLATAGKYCDRNIDVNVSVPSKDAELAEQKAITDSILNRSITEYANDTLTIIATYAFGYCRELHTLNCSNVTEIMAYSLYQCNALSRLDLPSLNTISPNAFRYSSVDTLILRRNGVCKLVNTNAFGNSLFESGTGYVYVPDDLVESYKTATNWVTFADQIKPISELGE